MYMLYCSYLSIMTFVAVQAVNLVLWRWHAWETRQHFAVVCMELTVSALHSFFWQKLMHFL